MKKLIMTIAILLGMTMTSFADGGLFQRNNNAANGRSGYSYFTQKNSLFESNDVATPLLPVHGETDNQPAPLGNGIAMLASLGAAYLVGKRRREE